MEEESLVNAASGCSGDVCGRGARLVYRVVYRCVYIKYL
jgi:hypothetical protein